MKSRYGNTQNGTSNFCFQCESQVFYMVSSSLIFIHKLAVRCRVKYVLQKSCQEWWTHAGCWYNSDREVGAHDPTRMVESLTRQQLNYIPSDRLKKAYWYYYFHRTYNINTDSRIYIWTLCFCVDLCSSDNFSDSYCCLYSAVSISPQFQYSGTKCSSLCCSLFILCREIVKFWLKDDETRRDRVSFAHEKLYCYLSF